MIRLVDILASGVTDDDGAILANGTVTAYLAGTTTLETLYEDFDLEEPHANPLTLSASGRAIAFTDERVKLVFHDSDGNLIRTIDNVGTADSDVPTSSSQAIPAGSIIGYGGDTAPAGWLMCDGSAKSRTTYADLFAAIGESYGAGDGSTTFNLPDSLGRTLVGAGAGSGLTSRAVGDEFGAETLPAHTHSITDPGHTHPLPSTLRTTDSGAGAATGADHNIQNASKTSTSATTGITATNSTGTGSHGVMQPSFVGNYIIKT